MIVLLQCSWCS